MKSVAEVVRSMVVELRSGFNYDRDAASVASGLECKDKSLAQQSQKEEADINVIVRRFGLTGEVPSNVRVPLQSDFVDLISYQECLNAVRDAEAEFMKLPAQVRSRFENDPAQFVEFCTASAIDKDTGELVLANRAELEKLGLLKEAPVQEKAPVVKEKPTDGSSAA